MTVLPRDPLLAALRILIYIVIGLLCFAAFGLIIGAPLALIFQDNIIAEMAKEGTAIPAGVIAAGAGLLLGFAAIIIAGIYFFWHLLAITDTVRDGDPFIPENANRLTRMGWIAVGVEVATFLLMIPGYWVLSALADAGQDVTWESGWDGSSLILILVLFVLARVFRQGAAMREDLEGTV